jgi:hypothetical protein
VKLAVSLAVLIVTAGGAVAVFVCDWTTTAGTEVNEAFIAAAKGKVAVFLSTKSSRRDHIIVEAEVTNNTDAPVDWDPEFAVPLQWKLASEGHMDLPKKVLGSSRSGSHVRFVRLRTGEKFVKEIDFTQGLTQFVCGHYTFHDEKRGLYHRAKGREDLVRFEIPENATSLIVELTARRDFEFSGGFQAYFGVDSKNLSLVENNLWSNVLTLNLEK